MSLVRTVQFEVLWKCGVDLESVVSTERWKLKGMSMNLERDSRTTATFWRWKERESNGGNKEMNVEAFSGRMRLLAMSCDCQEERNLLNLPGSGYI